jgi:hypothetical protein
MGKPKKPILKDDLDIWQHLIEGHCYCGFCLNARRRRLVHGEIGCAPVVFPLEEGEWFQDIDFVPIDPAEGVVFVKAIPFYVDRDKLVMTDSYPIVEH